MGEKRGRLSLPVLQRFPGGKCEHPYEAGQTGQWRIPGSLEVHNVFALSIHSTF